jgi:hypothetical protein
VVAREERLDVGRCDPHGQRDILDVGPAIVLQDALVGLATVAYGEEH